MARAGGCAAQRALVRVAGGNPVRVSVAGVVQVAVPFTWLGMVLAISFLETPLRFRAPGITVSLGLGIGRLVFRALAVTELVLAVALTLALLLANGTVTVGAVTWALTALLWAVLVVQTGILRPRLDHRARLVVAGESPPRSHMHLAYVALDGIKVVLLPILGVGTRRRDRAMIPAAVRPHISDREDNSLGLPSLDVPEKRLGAGMDDSPVGGAQLGPRGAWERSRSHGQAGADGKGLDRTSLSRGRHSPAAACSIRRVGTKRRSLRHGR